MIATQTTPSTTATKNVVSEPIPAPTIAENHNPARTLAALYHRCSPGGGCPYSLQQIIQVLEAFRYHGVAVATEIANTVGMPASAVYGCVLECEDYGLLRWIPEPVTTAEHVTAEITATGSRFLREIDLLPGASYGG